jgi:hypothetical protein
MNRKPRLVRRSRPMRHRRSRRALPSGTGACSTPAVHSKHELSSTVHSNLFRAHIILARVLQGFSRFHGRFSGTGCVLGDTREASSAPPAARVRTLRPGAGAEPQRAAKRRRSAQSRTQPESTPLHAMANAPVRRAPSLVAAAHRGSSSHRCARAGSRYPAASCVATRCKWPESDAAPNRRSQTGIDGPFSLCCAAERGIAMNGQSAGGGPNPPFVFAGSVIPRLRVRGSPSPTARSR